MPVAAVAGAVFAGAELVAGGLTVFQTIAAVGAITAGVGAVTGDQDLMKIGGIAGLAGGVGMFAQNQGWLNSTQAVAESGSNTASFLGEAAPGVEQVSPTVDTGAAIQSASDAGNTAMTGDSLLAADLGEILPGRIGRRVFIEKRRDRQPVADFLRHVRPSRRRASLRVGFCRSCSKSFQG